MCTSLVFQFGNRKFVANNEDIFLENGMIFSNQRSLQKVALIEPPEKPLVWNSRYGSLTFSQCMKEFPSAGMNEAGLVIEQMTLRETRYPAIDRRPAVKELQMIQYLLDTCKNVPEALDQLFSARISQAAGLVHYLICDEDTSALVEFLDGQMVIYEGAQFPVPVVANCMYAKSVERWQKKGTTKIIDQDEYAVNSQTRFIKAACLVEISSDAGWDDPVSYAFHSLDLVSRPDTIWNIVYDLGRKKIHFRTKWDPQIKITDLNSFDFSSTHSPSVYDMEKGTHINGLPIFEEYSAGINKKLASSFFKNATMQHIFGIFVPDDVLEQLSHYPDQMETVVVV